MYRWFGRWNSSTVSRTWSEGTCSGPCVCCVYKLVRLLRWNFGENFLMINMIGNSQKHVHSLRCIVSLARITGPSGWTVYKQSSIDGHWIYKQSWIDRYWIYLNKFSLQSQSYIPPPPTHTHAHTHHNIDDSEVLLESMADELDSSLEQVDELEVAGLERGQVLGAHGSVKVSRFDSWELCQVVHNLQYTISETFQHLIVY